MIEHVVEQWHRYLRGELPGGLDELLDDDVVFYSPIVFTPQRGKAITTLYLQAAAVALPGDAASAGGAPGRQDAVGPAARLPVHEEGPRRRHCGPRVRDHHRGQVRQRRRHHPVQRGRPHRRVPGHDPAPAGGERRPPPDGRRRLDDDGTARLTAAPDRHRGEGRPGGPVVHWKRALQRAALLGGRRRPSGRAGRPLAVVAAPAGGARRPGGPAGARGFAAPSSDRHPGGPSTLGRRPPSTGTAPGWFTDPFVRHEQRYWSGTAWTEHVLDGGTPAVDPPPEHSSPG